MGSTPQFPNWHGPFPPGSMGSILERVELGNFDSTMAAGAMVAMRRCEWESNSESNGIEKQSSEGLEIVDL